VPKPIRSFFSNRHRTWSHSWHLHCCCFLTIQDNRTPSKSTRKATPLCCVTGRGSEVSLTYKRNCSNRKIENFIFNSSLFCKQKASSLVYGSSNSNENGSSAVALPESACWRGESAHQRGAPHAKIRVASAIMQCCS
jgi:hypothetical protein